MNSHQTFVAASQIGSFCPYVSLLSEHHRGSLCDECFKECNLSTSCPGCSLFRYCSTACRIKNESIHKLECNLISIHSFKLAEISDEALFLFRLYYFSRSDGAHISEKILGQQRRFSDLMTHEENIRKDEKRCAEFVKLYAQIKKFTADSLPAPDSKELFLVFGKMVINSFSILNDDLNVIGTGLYLGPSALDHSCRPNCVVTFSGNQLLLRSVRPIKEGDEVTISYIEQMNVSRRRRKELMSSYYFTCTCEYCLDVERDKNMFGLLSKKKSEEDEEALERECLKLEQDVESFKKLNEWMKISSVAKSCMTRWLNRLSSQSIYTYKCKDLCFDAFITTQRWDKVASCGQDVIELHRHFNPDPHPKRAVDCLKYAKVLLLLEEFNGALQYMTKAKEEIDIVFGKSSQLSETAAILHYQSLMECNR